jgi:hypothetical protein
MSHELVPIPGNFKIYEFRLYAKNLRYGVHPQEFRISQKPLKECGLQLVKQANRKSNHKGISQITFLDPTARSFPIDGTRLLSQVHPNQPKRRGSRTHRQADNLKQSIYYSFTMD